MKPPKIVSLKLSFSLLYSAALCLALEGCIDAGMIEISLRNFHASRYLLEMEGFAKAHLKQFLFHAKRQKVNFPFHLRRMARKQNKWLCSVPMENRIYRETVLVLFFFFFFFFF